ncbi:hypothetical protein V8C43DRAFT_302787 [Trichoderma afarasin]
MTLFSGASNKSRSTVRSWASSMTTHAYADKFLSVHAQLAKENAFRHIGETSLLLFVLADYIVVTDWIANFFAKDDPHLIGNSTGEFGCSQSARLSVGHLEPTFIFIVDKKLGHLG